MFEEECRFIEERDQEDMYSARSQGVKDLDDAITIAVNQL